MTRNKKIAIIGGIILVIAIAVLTFQFSAPQKGTREKVRIVIGLYETTSPIKDAEEAFRMRLYEEGLIRNPFVFSIALRLKGMRLKDIEPGGYYIEKGLNVFELVEAFKEPDEKFLQEVELIPPDFFIPRFNEEGKIEFKAEEEQIELLE